MKKNKKEIRNLLLGKAVVDEEGRLVTPEAGTIRVPNGIADGAGAVRFLGVSGKTQYYETDLSEEEIMARAREHMRNSGRGVFLRQHPDAAACLIRYVLTRPALLVFRWVEGQGVLTAWTGRGIMSWASRLRAIRAFERSMGDVIRYSPAPPPEEEPEAKKNGRRKRKKASPEEAQTPPPGREEAPTDDYGNDYNDDYADDYGGEYAENYADDYSEEYSDETGEGYDGESDAAYAEGYDERYNEEYDRTDEEDRRE